MTFAKTKIIGSALIPRAILFAVIWWILADGAVASWWIGAPAVLLAAVTSVALLPPAPFLWLELLKFMPYFIVHSLLGGVDVARRAFQPDIRIAPELVEYALRLPPGLPRVFMANVVSLLPGTLGAALDETVLKVHVLDTRQDFLTQLDAVEQRVARMFGTSLKNVSGVA